MKNKYIIIQLLLLAFIGFQSCTKDFIELTPKTGQVEDNYYNNEQEAFLALIAAYDALHVQNWMSTHLMSEIWSDDAFAGGSGPEDYIGYQEYEQFNTSLENEQSANLWNRCYSGIYRTNLYLEKQENIEFDTEGLQAQYKAEAQILRAYYYWDLVRHFGWVPVVTRVLTVEEAGSAAQNTPDEVFTQIATDMMDAINSDALIKTANADEIGRFNEYAAKALLARMYLYHEGFAKPVLSTGAFAHADGTVIDQTYAINALGDVIAGPYSLLNNYADVFSWDNQNNEESIFEWQYSEKAKSDDWGGAWGINGNFAVVHCGPRSPVSTTSDYATAGWSFATLTWSLINEYEASDPRLDATVLNAETEFDSYERAHMNTGYFNKKYIPYTPHLATGGGVPDHNWDKNYIDIRYADVLLMAAELNLTSNSGLALGYFNQVRERALGSGTGLISITLADIQHERRVEFGGEGIRKWDMLRWGLTYAENAINSSFVVPTGAEQIIPAENFKASDFNGREWKDGYWGMFPIPGTEIRNMNSGVLEQYVPAYLNL